MIKVFNIISHIDIGGAERVAINIAKSKNPEFEYHVVEVVRSFYTINNRLPYIMELKRAFIETKIQEWNDLFLLNQKFMSNFIFRGQANSEWSLRTSLER